MSPPRSTGRWSGFTLVELLVVVLIIGILAAIALPRFGGQRTRARNAAAQAALRHALLAARSYYTQNSESYAGLGPTELRGYESSLSGNEPADTQAPGSSANPQDIWIGNGSSGSNPASGDAAGGKTVSLCSVSQGDTTYCVRDANGVSSFFTSTSNVAAGTLIDNGFNARSNGTTVPQSSGEFGSFTMPNDGSGSVTFDNAHPGYAADGTLSAMGLKIISGTPGKATLVRLVPNVGAMNTDNSEIRFWVYFNANTTSLDYFDNNIFSLSFNVDGGVYILLDTAYAPAPYNPSGFYRIGSYSANTLYQYRMVFNFTNKTYTVSYRTQPNGTWTYLYHSSAASPNIPFRSPSTTSTSLVNYLSAYTAATVWLDEFQYSKTGIDP